TASGADANFRELVDRYFNLYFAHSPTAATAAGFHQYDTRLEDYTKATVDEQIKGYRVLKQEFEKLDAGALSPEAAADHALVVSSINSALLELEEIRQWQKNPDVYSSGITQSAFLIMARKFAAPEQPLKSLIARERPMPKVFEAARANLENPPKIYTQVAIEQLPGIVS